MNTVKVLKIWTPENFAVIVLKFEQHRKRHPEHATRSNLIWVYAVYQDLTARKLRIVTVISQQGWSQLHWKVIN